jgi:hypothetical protein
MRGAQPPAHLADAFQHNTSEGVAMTTITQMMNAYPASINTDAELLAECVAACIECAQACTACADACLSEQTVAELAKCIRNNLDCADICDTTGRVLSRHTGYDANTTRAQLQACAQASRSCGDECERHSEMDHCRICSEVCRRCAEACDRVLAAIS